MGKGIAGVVGIFGEPEGGILDPLDMGVGLAWDVEVEVGIDVPGEEITGIVSV